MVGGADCQRGGGLRLDQRRIGDWNTIEKMGKFNWIDNMGHLLLLFKKRLGSTRSASGHKTQV